MGNASVVLNMRQKKICYLLICFSLTVLVLPLPLRAQAWVQVWVQRYNLSVTNATSAVPVALTLDINGNPCVAGYVRDGINYHCVTLKYSATGAPLWTNRYEGPDNLGGVPSAIAVDSGGNVFVTGSLSPPLSPVGHPNDYRYLTLAYSGAGTPLWTNIWFAGGGARAVAITVGQNGDVFVTGNSAVTTNAYANMTTIAYSSTGAVLWTNRFKGPWSWGSSSASAMALAPDGDVIVAGGYADAQGYDRAVVVAYSGTGRPVWTNQYEGPSNFGESLSAVALDVAGNVFATGSSGDTNGFYDYLTLGYSSAGVPLWTNRYHPGNFSRASAIAVGTSGNAFVTGLSDPAAGSPDYSTVAYNAAGAPLWTNRYDGPVHQVDSATAVAVDFQGNAIVTGASDVSDTNSDYLTIAYSSAGLPIWTNQYEGTGHGWDNATALALDRAGNLFVTGSSWNGVRYDFTTIKYANIPRLSISGLEPSNAVVLSWLNPLFYLQSAPSSSGTFTNIPGAVSPYTNVSAARQQFFRLISQ